MKIFTLFICLFSLVFSTKLNAQNAICDSIEVDSAYIDNNMLNITVYNSSQHFIVYPIFTLNLNSNSYISLNDSVTVLSYLSIGGDANNGFTSASYIGNIAAENTVPLNTTFTGVLTITDPNDTSFSCAYPFNFTYGTMPTMLNNIDEEDFIIYPLPASAVLNVKVGNLAKSSPYFIIDKDGKTIKTGILNKSINSIDLNNIVSGMYTIRILNEKPIVRKIVIIK